MASLSRRPTGTVTGAMTAIHLLASDVDSVDETDGSEIRYYMTLEATGEDTLKSPVFSGDYEWEGLIPSAAATWTAHLRKEEDDSSVANLEITAS